jgi:hypothetical protein
MCSDLDATLGELKRKGVAVKNRIRGEPWGRLATMILPGGSELPIYEPKHPSPPHE